MSETETETKIVEEPQSSGVAIIYTVDEILVERQTAHQHLMIAETAAYGRALFLDRLIQSTETDEVLYHEPLIHPALLIHGHARRVLVAGAGEGASLRELVRHREVEHIVAVDLDPEVIAASRAHLQAWHQGAFDDPRVELRFEDIQTTLAGCEDGSVDVIVLDITDPVEAGPSVDLFTVRFYREVARVLADDGLVVLQAGELDPSDLRVAQATRSTLAAVFPWVHMAHSFVPSFHCLWGFLLAGKRAFDLDPPDLEARIAALEGLRMYDLVHHRALLRLPRFLAEQVEQPGPIVTGDDDERLISYAIER